MTEEIKELMRSLEEEPDEWLYVEYINKSVENDRLKELLKNG